VRATTPPRGVKNIQHDEPRNPRGTIAAGRIDERACWRGIQARVG
jgi:hypothetical protein